MSSSKESPRSVERISHLFLSAQSPSRDDEVGPSRETRPSGQLELPIGLKEGGEEGTRLGSRSGLSGSGRSRPPLTLLDFLLDDEAADKTE